MVERQGVDTVEVANFDTIFGSGETAGQVVLSEENLRAQLADVARLGVSPDLVNVVSEDGKEYYVSKGDEHFVDFEGEDDGVMQELRPQLSGYRLMRQRVRRDQDLQPVLLVKNGVVDSPVASINAGSGFVFEGEWDGIVTDPERIKAIFQKVLPIVKDSIDKAKQEKLDKKEKSRTIARKVRAGVIVATVAVGSIMYGPSGFNWVRQQYRQYQLDQKLEDEAKKAREQAELDQRIANTREFDLNHSIPSSVPTTDMDTPGIATGSNEFDNVRVPDIDATSIPQSLAGDITAGPREIKLDDLEEGSCQDVEDVITGDETEFRVIHNGGAGSQRFYNVFMDTKSHTLTVCDAGAQDGATEVQEAEATSIFVEARQG